MPYTLKAPERKSFRLEQLDNYMGIPEEDATRVTIRQAATRQNADRAELFEEFIREVTVGGKGDKERIIYRLPIFELTAREVWLTMMDCNILGPNGIPMFPTRQTNEGPVLNMTFEKFKEAWGTLPDIVVQEIHSKVLEVNPHWAIGNTVEDANLGEGS